MQGLVLTHDLVMSPDDRFLYESIVRGRPNTAMPQWHFLPPEDVADLITFFRSWESDEAPKQLRRLRKGDAASGKELYGMACLNCHGEAGQGGVGGQLANPVFLDVASDSFLWNSIAHGKSGTR